MNSGKSSIRGKVPRSDASPAGLLFVPRVPPEARLQESEQPRRDLAGDQIDWPLPKKSGRDALAGLLHARRIPKLQAASSALRPCKPERHIALRGRSPGNWNPSVRSLHTYRSVAAATGAAARIARCVNPKSLKPCKENLRRFRFSPLFGPDASLKQVSILHGHTSDQAGVAGLSTRRLRFHRSPYSFYAHYPYGHGFPCMVRR